MENSNKIQINISSITSWLFGILAFLLPIFVLPLQNTPLAVSKSIIFYGGVIICFFLWLLSVLQKGEIKLPKSILILSTVFLIIVWLINSLLSPNKMLSLIGRGYEVDTFAFILFGVLSLFLASILFDTPKRGMIFYLLLLASSVFFFVFEFLYLVFGVKIIPFNIFNNKLANLVGGWNDVGIFFGFVGLVSLVIFELYKGKAIFKVLSAILILISLLMMMIVNFYTGWIIFGVFVFALFAYLLSRSFSKPSVNEIEIGGENIEMTGGETNITSQKPKSLLRLSFLVFLIVLFCIVAFNSLGRIGSSLGVNYLEVSPSWQATFNIIKETLKVKPITGSGPNTFVYDWLKYKPQTINLTAFWDFRFNSGMGQIPSFFATGGVLSILAILFFLATILIYAYKAISIYGSGEGEGGVFNIPLVASLLGSLYLWAFVIFYSPGFVIFALAFINTGLLVAMLGVSEKIKFLRISFVSSPAVGFVSVLGIAVLVLGAIFSFYLLFQKTSAVVYYDKGISAFNFKGDIENARSYLVKAISFDRQDNYLRALAEIDLLKVNQIVFDKNLPADQALANFQNALGTAIQDARAAIQVNPLEPLNWIETGRIYENVIPLKIGGADTMAIDSYKEAANRSPLDPTIPLAIGRVYFQTSNIDEARNNLQTALKIKSDLADAIFLLSQVEAQAGNLKEAISRAEQTFMLAPNDIGVLFHLGLLYYRDNNLENARLALERAVALNNEYANARYFLGLVYDKQNMKDKALEQFEAISKTNPDNEEVKQIIENLKAGRGALETISPPAPQPEKRSEPPIKNIKKKQVSE